MTLQLALQRFKGRGYSLQSVRRTIGGITARVVLSGPPATRWIVCAKLPAFFQELPIECSRAGALQGRGVDEGGEQGPDGHPLKTSGGVRAWEPGHRGPADDHSRARADRFLVPRAPPRAPEIAPAVVPRTNARRDRYSASDMISLQRLT